MRLLPAALVAIAACGSDPGSAPVRLLQTSHAGQRTLAVVPNRGVRINARLPPAIELSGGSVIRLVRGRISSDSSYFLDPPWGMHPGPEVIRGELRVSYCRRDEALCRSVMLPVRLPEKRAT